MEGAVAEVELDPSGSVVGGIQVSGLGHEHLLPARLRIALIDPDAFHLTLRSRAELVHVEDQVRKVGEEDPRPEVGGEVPADHGLTFQLPAEKARAREHQVVNAEGEQRRDQSVERDRAQEETGAEAGALKGDPLVIAGQAPQADQHAQESGHGNRQDQRPRELQGQGLQRPAPAVVLRQRGPGDQEQVVHEQDERVETQAKGRGPQQFAPDVALKAREESHRAASLGSRRSPCQRGRQRPIRHVM
jgi:hypothetical protein